MALKKDMHINVSAMHFKRLLILKECVGIDIVDKKLVALEPYSAQWRMEKIVSVNVYEKFMEKRMKRSITACMSEFSVNYNCN